MKELNNKLKVITIVGTRPEIIRLSEILKKCDKYFDHKLIFRLFKYPTMARLFTAMAVGGQKPGL